MKYKHKKTGAVINLDDYKEMKDFMLDGELVKEDADIWIVSNSSNNKGFIQKIPAYERMNYSEHAWFRTAEDAAFYALRHSLEIKSDITMSIINAFNAE